MCRISRARGLGVLAVVAALGVAVAACGGGESETGTPGAAVGDQKVNTAARQLLPADVKSAGELKIATSLQWPPFGFKGDGGKPEGIDLDIMRTVSARLGLKPAITDITFDSLVPSVSNGRFDVAVNELADIPERRKVVQFVDYYKSGLAILVPEDSTSDISPTDMCGHKMSLTQGSSQAVLGAKISKQCVADGKPPIHFQLFSDSASTILAVANKRVEGFMTDYGVGVYLTRTKNKTLKVLPGVVPNSAEKAGIVIAKDNDQLAKAVQTALQSMIDDGSYQRIMKRWGVGGRTVSEATINLGEGTSSD
jgi:polar amino acid transport system substrate-binding protein